MPPLRKLEVDVLRQCYGKSILRHIKMVVILKQCALSMYIEHNALAFALLLFYGL